MLAGVGLLGVGDHARGGKLSHGGGMLKHKYSRDNFLEITETLTGTTQICIF
jgi:hypothetical protein